MPVIVFSCCSSKAPKSSFRLRGQAVSFFANPDPANSSEAYPDQIMPGTNTTYRDSLIEYNRNPENQRDFDLPKASFLYEPPTSPKIYQDLGNSFRHFYILSAGWGIVRKDFCLPDYDITFANQAENQKKRKWRRGWNWAYRDQESEICDFNHLKEDIEKGIVSRSEEIHFAGGNDYRRRFQKMVVGIENEITLWFYGANAPKMESSRSNIKTSKFNSDACNSRTWPYFCARWFIQKFAMSL